jgi:hypothetical protein
MMLVADGYSEKWVASTVVLPPASRTIVTVITTPAEEGN